MTLKVAHWGTGFTGREGLRAIIEDPALELIALLVTTPDRIGKDAGELAGLEQTVGIKATNDINAVLELKPDCLFYGASGAGRELEAAEDMSRFLDRGINVVTISHISMVYPPAGPEKVREVLNQACNKGQASYFNSGSSPGWISAELVTSVLSAAGRVDQVVIQEFVNPIYYAVEDAMRNSMGLGQPKDYIPKRFSDGVVEAWWEPMVHHAADVLNVPLDDVSFEWQTAITDIDIETAFGLVEAGTIGGYHTRLSGMSKGQPVVCFDHIVRLSDKIGEDWWGKPIPGKDGGCRIIVEGRPRIVIDCESETGVQLTATHVVNAIPVLCAATPGIYGPDDLPRFVTRNVPAAIQN